MLGLSKGRMALVFAHGLGAAVRQEVECKNAKQQCESGSSRHTPPVYWLEDLAKDAGWATSSAAGAGLSRQHPKRERCGTAPALVKVRKGERILWNFNHLDTRRTLPGTFTVAVLAQKPCVMLGMKKVC